MLKVLCLEDSTQDVEIIRELLVDAGFDLTMDSTAREQEFASMLRTRKYDIILADFKLPGFDAFAALRWAKEIVPHVPFICVSGSIGEETAVEILKHGAVDYILKDRLAKLPSAIERALRGEKEKEAHQRAEETLQESERRLREAQEMAHLGFWNWNIKTGEVEWSEEVFKIFGLDPKTFTPQIDSILALSPWPEDHQRDQELIKKAIETHNPGSYEQKFLRPDQSIGYYYSTFQGNYDEKGDLISIVGTVLDITERKRAEMALRESEDKFKYIFDNSAIGKSITLTSGKINSNKALCEMLGYSEEELNILNWQDITHPDDIDLNQKALQPLLSGEKNSTRFVKRYIHKNGSIVWGDVSTTLRRDNNGNAMYYLTSVNDITERKQAEEKILQQLEELRRWQEFTLGREDRNRQLKKEVNELLKRLGEPIRYPSQEGESTKDAL
jgi:PAS domain S-box-containing protein